MSTGDPRREWSAAGTFIEQCPDESAHGEHEWYEKNLFRRQCLGFVGRAGVDPMAYTEDMTAPIVIPADQFDELLQREPGAPTEVAAAQALIAPMDDALKAAYFAGHRRGKARGGAAGWTAGVRWAAAEADAQCVYADGDRGGVLDITDHLRLCASNPERESAIPRDEAPEHYVGDVPAGKPGGSDDR